MSAKKYVSIFLVLLLLFVLFHAFVWFTITKQIFQPSDNLKVGDLGRMSYLKSSFSKRELLNDLPRKHNDFTKIEQIDIVTIGDSFSNGAAAGKNPFYQDYIATDKNLTVLNIQPLKEGYIETVVALYNSGFLKEISPKIIILESVERTCIGRFSKEIDWNFNLNKEKLLQDFQVKYDDKKPELSLVNNLNYNAFLYSILYYFDDKAFFSSVYLSEVSKKLFSGREQSKFLYFKDDLTNIDASNERSISLLNDNLNALQKLLKQKNTQLYFMPAVDKYNLYSKYIVKNKYPQSKFYELLRELPHDYYFVDTKLILQKLTDNDVIDVYYPDDTHWSYKASAEISKSLAIKLD
ncbi:MAG: hypothetical protein WBK95_02340 [Sulfurimonas sp.]|nr:hypothetical protein [Sulfurimonas sp.]MDD5202880.1 hypothetical protein [Sulfurimonas sp.]